MGDSFGVGVFEKSNRAENGFPIPFQPTMDFRNGNPLGQVDGLVPAPATLIRKIGSKPPAGKGLRFFSKTLMTVDVDMGSMARPDRRTLFQQKYLPIPVLR